jgi:hypothetical protein
MSRRRCTRIGYSSAACRQLEVVKLVLKLVVKLDVYMNKFVGSLQAPLYKNLKKKKKYSWAERKNIFVGSV